MGEVVDDFGLPALPILPFQDIASDIPEQQHHGGVGRKWIPCFTSMKGSWIRVVISNRFSIQRGGKL
jgi:hypothetical protein